VLLDEAHLNIGYFSFGEQWDWGSDVYYNDQWYLNLGALKPYTGQYYYPNRTAATNHWYRQYVDEYVPTYGTTTWESYIAVCN
jgi:hypothetical protein